jgi:hypothetical protein
MLITWFRTFVGRDQSFTGFDSHEDRLWNFEVAEAT